MPCRLPYPIGCTHLDDDVDSLFAKVAAVPSHHKSAASQAPAHGTQDALHKVLSVVFLFRDLFNLKHNRLIVYTDSTP